MIYAVNIATILLAIIYAFVIASEKKKYWTSFGMIAVGIFFYLYEALLSLFAGKCNASGVYEFLQVIDRCVNYESGDMIIYQAMIIAGFTVIFVSYALSRYPDK